jgi:hypothetical protein
MPNQANGVKMTKMLARIAVVFVTIVVRVPLVRIICVRMMGLMKRVVIHRLSRAFQARYEQGNHQQLWNPRFHTGSIHSLDSARQTPVT